MKLQVLIEPQYRHSFWCEQTLAGIRDEVRRKKYTLLPADTVEADCPEAIFTVFRRDAPVIVIGSSLTWVPQILAFLAENDVRAIVLCPETAEPSAGQSIVRIDYSDAIRRLLERLPADGHPRIALFGVHSDSAADAIKERCFCAGQTASGVSDPQDSVFRNREGLHACSLDFLRRRDNFDAVICANELAAVYLAQQLRRQDGDLLSGLQLVCFGRSPLTELAVPKIMTVSLDHTEIGIQAVRLYAYLAHQSQRVSVTVSIQSTLSLGGAVISPGSAGGAKAPADVVGEGRFYHDAPVQELLRLEKLLLGFDALDYDILAGLGSELSIDAIAAACNAGVSTVNYHLRNMYHALGVRSRQELCDYLRAMLGIG